MPDCGRSRMDAKLGVGGGRIDTTPETGTGAADAVFDAATAVVDPPAEDEDELVWSRRL